MHILCVSVCVFVFVCVCGFLHFLRMKALNISPSDNLICFGQLLGMCDHVSYSLGKENWSICLLTCFIIKPY